MYYFNGNYSNTCANDCIAKGGGLKATSDQLFTILPSHVDVDDCYNLTISMYYSTLHALIKLSQSIVSQQIHIVYELTVVELIFNFLALASFL
jgi:hypothetical protein